MSTAELIGLLHAMLAEPTIEPVLGEDTCLNWGYLEDRHRLVQEIVNMAAEVLIKPDGDRNYSAEIALETAGFPVFCLEKDGFGWLTGGIETDKGVIAYG
jgi:hypothetical protein